jgi:hypothetical protein
MRHAPLVKGSGRLDTTLGRVVLICASRGKLSTPALTRSAPRLSQSRHEQRLAAPEAYVATVGVLILRERSALA